MSYFSIDVETAGTVAGRHSLFSVGIVEVSTGQEFYKVIKNDPIIWEESTRNWWQEHPAALAEVMGESDDPKTVANAVQAWVSLFPEPYVFVAWPASFDKPFLDILFWDAEVQNPFTHRSVDIKSWICGKYGLDPTAHREAFGSVVKDLYFESELPHHALSDARSQAMTFKKLLELRYES